MSAVNGIEAGLNKTTSEIIAYRKLAAPSSDRFGAVMQVRRPFPVPSPVMLIVRT